ncbi:MAG: hypothetical protein KY468_14890 [Armatimonadetes bacterium]|nr:hypothetical protein [Armatimonadota bacterium]
MASSPPSLQDETSVRRVSLSLPAARTRLPLPKESLSPYFEANKGQAEKSARFVSRGNGYRLSLTRQGAVLDLTDAVEETGGNVPEGASPRNSRIRMILLEGNTRPAIRGIWKQKGTASGPDLHDPKKVRKNIPTFKKVLYERVYPGINLVFHGNPARLDYDFVVYPRANPDRIRIAFEGADRIELDAGENLLLSSAGGGLRQQRPVLYQVIGGERREISGGYYLDEDSALRFRVGEYDPMYPLVITRSGGE